MPQRDLSISRDREYFGNGVEVTKQKYEDLLCKDIIEVQKNIISPLEKTVENLLIANRTANESVEIFKEKIMLTE